GGRRRPPASPARASLRHAARSAARAAARSARGGSATPLRRRSFRVSVPSPSASPQDELGCASQAVTLRDADVQRDGAEAEAAIAHVAQARAAHRVGEAGWAREALDRLRQVGVRRPITGHERADERHDAVEVDPEYAIPAGYARPRDVEGDDEAAGHPPPPNPR